MLTDSLGNPVHLDQADSLPLLHDFVGGFLTCESRVARILQAASTDHSAIVQAACAALHMFAESADAPQQARPFITTALRRAPQASEREQRFVAAVAAWVAGDVPRAIKLHQEQARLHPRDLASVKLGQYHLFNRGQGPAMLHLALQVLPHAPEVPQLHGMAAFGWEQCHLLPQAEAAARHALSLCTKEPWAQHAIAHVMLTQGRLQEGLQFMQHASSTWVGLNSFMQTHNWWHLALFALELGDAQQALQLYDSQVWGVVKEYSQDQIGAVSLLARLELAGVDVGDRWQDVADHLVARVHDHVLPFLDMQYLYGLARAGRPEAATLLGSIEAHCQGMAAANLQASGNPVADDVWERVCLPASRGLLAHAQGRHREAVEALGTALPRMLEIGGSHAQRDLFAQIHLDALVRAGAWSSAQQILQPQINSQPESRRLQRQAAPVYQALGLTDALADASA
ncbi:MAG: tetratricopeptide repeat protein [Rhodoferax sp.]|nr:tetratricopeptide repeat protein [Rhodoferax sp.]